MKVVASLVSYPPHRFIGSELMTHQMLLRLKARGHEVQVITHEKQRAHKWEGIPVRPGALPDGDVFIYHADYGHEVEDLRVPKVAICHNSRIGVRVGIQNSQPDVLTVNSQFMSAELPHPRKVVVHPPLVIPVNPVTGGRVTVINLEATNKVGPFWELATMMPDIQFLAVKGGYGDQAIPDVVPPNVKLIEQVAPAEMAAKVWAETRVLLVPSATESWSMVASEAMSYGIPVVANPLPSLLENLQGVGVWADREQAWQWDQAIRSVLRSWSEFSAAVHERAVEQAARWDAEVEIWCDEVERIGHG